MRLVPTSNYDLIVVAKQCKKQCEMFPNVRTMDELNKIPLRDHVLISRVEFIRMYWYFLAYVDVLHLHVQILFSYPTNNSNSTYVIHKHTKLLSLFTDHNCFIVIYCCAIYRID